MKKEQSLTLNNCGQSSPVNCSFATPSSNLIMMKAISFIEKYYMSKQMLQINQSTCLLHSYIKNNQNHSLDLLVPYTESQNVSQQCSFNQVMLPVQTQLLVNNYEVQTINSGRQIFPQLQFDSKCKSSSKDKENFIQQTQNFTDEQDQQYLQNNLQDNDENIKHKGQNVQKKGPKTQEDNVLNHNNDGNSQKYLQCLTKQKMQLKVLKREFQEYNIVKQNWGDNVLNYLKQTADFRQSKLKGWNKKINNCNVNNQDNKSISRKFQKVTNSMRRQIPQLNQQNTNTSNQLQKKTLQINDPKIMKYKKSSLKQQILKKIQIQKKRNAYNGQTKIQADKQFLRRFLK